MGMFWQFFSFEPDNWNSLFDGSLPNARKCFVSAAWESTEADMPDPEEDHQRYLDFLWHAAPREVVEVAEHVATQGPSYEGLSPTQSAILDSMLTGFFGCADMESILDYTTDHKMGVSSKAIGELLSRAESLRIGGFLGLGGRVSAGCPVALAPWLATGRRHRSPVSPSPEDKYFIFEPREVPDLQREVEALLEVDRPWRTAEFEQSIRQELLECLKSAAVRHRYVAGRLS